MKGKGKNMRRFFEGFASDRGMDPLSNHTWYTTPQILISDTEVQAILLLHFIFYLLLYSSSSFIFSNDVSFRLVKQS